MTNFKFISKLTTIVVASCCCVVVAGGGISILDNDFTVKATIECYNATAGTNFQAKTSAKETYSARDRRAVVRLSSVANDGSNPIEYYHDAKQGSWLQVIEKENLCISSSQYDLHLRLYESAIFLKMDQIYNAICPECTGDTSIRHLIGSAKLLALVRRVRPRFLRPIEIKTRTLEHLTMYLLDGIKVDESSSVDLYVHYNKILDATSRPSQQVQPQFIRIDYKTNKGEKYTIAVTFYQFELLLDVASAQNQADQLQSNALAFPTGTYCSSALSSSTGVNKQAEVQMIQDELSGVRQFSFSARELDHPSSIAEMFYALDLEAKLIRKDVFVDEDVRSTTIYNLNEKIKYNNIVTSRRESSTGCVMNKLDASVKINESNVRFINFEQLVYMGKAKINSVEALIFEEFTTKYTSSSLHFWIQPPVSAAPSPGDDTKSPPVRAGKIHGDHIYITYYFALGSSQSTYGTEPRGAATGRIGPLMRVELTARDAVSRLVWQRRLVISEFVADRLVESHLGLDGVQMFSLARMCQLEPKVGLLSGVLESADVSSEEVNSILAEPTQLQEILIEALQRDFRIQRTQIDRVSTRLSRTKSDSSVDKTVINLELSLSRDLKQSLASIECVYLGRGQMLGYESEGKRNYTGVATFEDCMWLAHKHLHDDLGEEDVLFTYTDRVECLVDRLFRYRALSGHEAVLAGSETAKSLNYFPYEYGKNMMFTLKKGKYQGTSVADLDSDAGMIFFQLGSLKIIGQSLSLKLANNEKKGFKFSGVKLSGSLAEAYGESLARSKRISGLTWSDKDASKDVGSRSKLIAFDGSSESSSAPSLAGGSQMNEPLCQSHCLLDLSCNSYSFCARWANRESRCLLSSIDVSKTIVMKQLESIRDNLTRSSPADNRFRGGGGGRRRRRSATITFDEGSLQQPEVEVVLDRACSISGKSHSHLFRQTYPVSVQGNLIESVDRSIKDKDECAKKCFAKNINHLKNLATIGSVSGAESEAEDTISNDHLVSNKNRIRDGTKELCTGFLYTDKIPSSNSSGKSVRGCSLITGSEELTHHLTKHDQTTKDEDKISMFHHKLIFSHLFRRIPSLRMLAGSEPEELTGTIGHQEKSTLESHLRGLNSQVKLPMDDVEFCARACILQLHGPSPICSSFDFVREKAEDNTIMKYCLLNSQSLHNLEQTNLTHEQHILHESQNDENFWHFEPRSAVLQTSNSALSRRIPEAERIPVEHSRSSAFMSISLLALKAASLISGLILGIKFTSYILKVTERTDEPVTHAGKTARLIHRLSGVSLRSNLREEEVQM